MTGGEGLSLPIGGVIEDVYLFFLFLDTPPAF